MADAGRFKAKRNKFSQVSNEALRDENLSLKAKGLYALIQSYVTIDNFILYKTTLIKQCKEKETSFNSAWNELKKYGYLIQSKSKDSTTGKWVYEYELLDVPGEETTPGFSTPGFSTPGFSTCGKHGVYNNTDLNNTDLNNTNNNIYSDFEKIIIKKYPGKKVKSIRDKKVPKLLKQYSKEQLEKAIDNYRNECKDKDKQYILNESTFWNGRYLDYLESETKDNSNTLPSNDNKENNYDFLSI